MNFKSVFIRPGVVVEIKQDVHAAVVEKSHKVANEEFFYLYIYAQNHVPFSSLNIYFDKTIIERVSVTSEKTRKGGVVITTYKIKVRLKQN